MSVSGSTSCSLHEDFLFSSSREVSNDDFENTWHTRWKRNKESLSFGHEYPGYAGQSTEQPRPALDGPSLHALHPISWHWSYVQKSSLLLPLSPPTPNPK